MSRRRGAETRPIKPDPKYNSKIVEKFINNMMYDGKKMLARKIVYRAVERAAKITKVEDALEGFLKALENVKPSLEVKSRRIGGATLQVPVQIREERQNKLAMNWLRDAARGRSGNSMEEKLGKELAEAFQMQGGAFKKREDTHRMAEANKAFAGAIR